MENKREAGAAYEKEAAKYLESEGYQILARNYRCRQGEIDLIAKEGRCLVFVEVKYRASGDFGEPQAAVDRRKQKRICTVAAYYCMRNGISESQPCRFDVVAICGSRLTLIKNAFDYVR